MASAAGRLARRSPLPTPHSALTLIELLIVLAILSILVGSAIPVLSPASDDRRIREASRGVNAFLAGAQTRAVETGRPFGVRLKKLSQDTGNVGDNAVSLELSYVEQPPPFAGFDESSRVMITQHYVGGNIVPGQFRIRFVAEGNTPVDPGLPGGAALPVGIDLDQPPPNFLARGDLIEVNGLLFEFNDTQSGSDVEPLGFYDDHTIVAKAVQGNSATLLTPSNDGVTYAIRPVFNNNGTRILDAGVDATNNLHWTEPQPYLIHRQPTPTSNEPFELPEGTAIDLRASGIGGVPFYEDEEFNGVVATNPILPANANSATTSNRDPIHILFSPEGTIERVQFNTGRDGDANESNATTDTLFLLIGLRENAPASSAAQDADFGNANEAGAGGNSEIEGRKAEINWLNGDARWIAVGARTGTVLTTENAFVDPVRVVSETGLTNFPADLTARRIEEISRARELARTRAQDGGK